EAMRTSTLQDKVSATVVTTEAAYEDVEQVPLSPSYWAKSGITHYDASAFFLVDKVTDVHGNQSTIAYDADKLFVTQVTDAKSNTVTATIDYRVLAPSKLTG